MQLIKNSCLALVVTIVSSLVLAGPSQAGALEDYNNGSAYFSMGRLPEAIRWFDKSIAYGKKGFAEPYVNKGFCLQKLGYHDRAIPCYDAAIKINPNLAVAYQNRGTSYLHLKRYQESLRDLNKAISLPREPSLSSVTVYIDRGRAYAGLKRWKESFADFDYVMSMQTTTGNMSKLKLAAAEEKKKAQVLMAEVGQVRSTTSSAAVHPTTAAPATTSEKSRSSTATTEAPSTPSSSSTTPSKLSTPTNPSSPSTPSTPSEPSTHSDPETPSDPSTP